MKSHREGLGEGGCEEIRKECSRCQDLSLPREFAKLVCELLVYGTGAFLCLPPS